VCSYESAYIPYPKYSNMLSSPEITVRGVQPSHQPSDAQQQNGDQHARYQ